MPRKYSHGLYAGIKNPHTNTNMSQVKTPAYPLSPRSRAAGAEGSSRSLRTADRPGWEGPAPPGAAPGQLRGQRGGAAPSCRLSVRRGVLASCVTCLLRLARNSARPKATLGPGCGRLPSAQDTARLGGHSGTGVAMAQLPACGARLPHPGRARRRSPP